MSVKLFVFVSKIVYCKYGNGVSEVTFVYILHLYPCTAPVHTNIKIAYLFVYVCVFLYVLWALSLK